jgi:L-alanine-DL-glutamate epimerase-like enolase superfamily enzyme
MTTGTTTRGTTGSSTRDRIASITTYAVDHRLETPMADAVHYIPSRAALLVEVTTESGRVGIG